MNSNGCSLGLCKYFITFSYIISCLSLAGYIEKGKEGGAKCEVGGTRHGEEGYFVLPTLFTDVTDDMVRLIDLEVENDWNYCFQ